MATDLSTLTETELTELLSSVTPYSKQEMISFLRMKVKILDKWEKDDIAHTATIHFTPIKDVRALKYIEQHPNMGAGGGGQSSFSSWGIQPLLETTALPALMKRRVRFQR